MKRTNSYASRTLTAALFIALCALCFSCEKVEEIPPIKKEGMTTSKEIRLPEPERLTPEEQGTVAAIRKEYEDSTN